MVLALIEDWALIPLTALAIPIVAILSGPLIALIKRKERDEARKLYERIVMEKLDVIKTAVAMGFKQDDISELDARLEKLVGAKKISTLLDSDKPKTPSMETELLDLDLEDEVQRAKSSKKSESG